MTGAVESRRAVRSAARPVGVKDRGRVPLALLVAFPALLGLGLLVLGVGGLLGLPGGLVLSATAAIALAGGVRAGLRLWNAPGPGLVGAPLTAAQEPGVWTMIVDAAARVRVPAPRRLVVDGSALVRLAPSAEGLNLAVGLPLLLQLGTADLHAVLARELAQCADAGPPAAARVRRLGERLDAALAGPRGPVRWLLARYRSLHAGLGRDAVRQAARAADQLAEAAVGRPELARGTERLVAVQLAWQALVEDFLPLAAAAGARPGLAEGLWELVAHRGEDLPTRAALPGNPTPLDRLDPLPGLFENPATVDRIEAAVLRDDRAASPWPQVGAAIGAAATGRAASRLAGAVPTGAAQPTLSAVLAALERPDRPVDLSTGLPALGRHALISAGRARFGIGWAGPPPLERLDPRGGWIPWDGAQLEQAAVEDPAAVGALRSWLVAAGADLGLALTRYAPQAGSAAGPMQVSGPVSEQFGDGGTPTDLLVFADGVLLLPAGTGPGKDRLAGVVRAVGDSPRTARAGRWIGAAEVPAGVVRERRHGLELQLRFADGSALVATSTEGTALRGDPVGDLRRLLADDDS